MDHRLNFGQNRPLSVLLLIDKEELGVLLPQPIDPLFVMFFNVLHIYLHKLRLLLEATDRRSY